MFDGCLRPGADRRGLAPLTTPTPSATYRQTRADLLPGVEDDLAALRILEAKLIGVQDDAVKAARMSDGLTASQYKAGTDRLPNVVHRA